MDATYIIINNLIANNFIVTIILVIFIFHYYNYCCDLTITNQILIFLILLMQSQLWSGIGVAIIGLLVTQITYFTLFYFLRNRLEYWEQKQKLKQQLLHQQYNNDDINGDSTSVNDKHKLSKIIQTYDVLFFFAIAKQSLHKYARCFL